MPDLNTMFPQIDTNNAPLGYFGGAMLGDMFNMSKQNNQLNQARMSQDLTYNDQMNPLKMNTERAQASNLDATARHSGALADTTAHDLEQKKRLDDPTYLKALADLKAGTTEAEVKQAHAQIEGQLVSPDPQVRAHATEMYKATGKMLEMYEKERVTAAGNLAVAKEHSTGLIEAHRLMANARAKGPTTWRGELQGAKGDPIKQYGILLRAELDPTYADDKDVIQTMRDAMYGPANAELKLKYPGYVMDPKGNLTQNPQALNPGIPAPGAPATTQPTQQYTPGQAYPGKTGTFKYKGGDPKDKTNWEKVQ